LSAKGEMGQWAPNKRRLYEALHQKTFIHMMLVGVYFGGSRRSAWGGEDDERRIGGELIVSFWGEDGDNHEIMQRRWQAIGTTAERAPSKFFFAFFPPEFFPSWEAFAATECKTKVRPISDTNEFQTP
jgi:hypothetical protein